jgi:hypothetical protein
MYLPWGINLNADELSKLHSRKVCEASSIHVSLQAFSDSITHGPQGLLHPLWNKAEYSPA